MKLFKMLGFPEIPTGTYITLPSIVKYTKSQHIDRLISQYAIAYDFCGDSTKTKLRICRELNKRVKIIEKQ